MFELSEIIKKEELDFFNSYNQCIDEKYNIFKEIRLYESDKLTLKPEYQFLSEYTPKQIEVDIKCPNAPFKKRTRQCLSKDERIRKCLICDDLDCLFNIPNYQEDKEEESDEIRIKRNFCSKFKQDISLQTKRIKKLKKFTPCRLQPSIVTFMN